MTTAFSDGVPAGVWVFISIYLVGLLALGAWHGYMNRDKDGTPKDHFLAGKNMGVWTAMLSMYASSWSGYNIIGSPGDSYKNGFYFVRRYPGNVWYTLFTGWMAPRIHFYSHRRNYEGTADFIADRFRNHTLSILAVIFSIIPVMLYIMGQLVGVGGTMHTMTGGAISPFAAASIFIVIMLFYEMLGGMAAIAMTDVLQAGILLSGWMVYFVIGPAEFGGTLGVTNDFLACAKLYDGDHWDMGELWLSTRGLDPFVYVGSNGLADVPPIENTEWWADTEAYDKNAAQWYDDYLEARKVTPEGVYVAGTPTAHDMKFLPVDSDWEEDTNSKLVPIYLSQDGGEDSCPLPVGENNGPETAASHITMNNDRLAGWFSFSFGGICFMLYPHIMDRYYAAKSVHVLRSAVMFAHIAIWLAIPSSLMGYWVSTFPGMTNLEANDVFSNYLEYIIEDNWITYIIGCLIFSAAFAAFMSTADSGLMGFSSAISLDIGKYYIPYFNDSSDKKAQDRRLVMLGKVTSVCAAFIALVLSTVEDLNFPLTDLYAYQGSFLFQVFPAYFLGFFFRGVCSYSVCSGLICGAICITTLNVGYQDEKFESLPHVFWAMIVNFGVIGVVELLLRAVGKHPGFEPSVRKKWLDFDEMDIGYVGFDMSSVNGPRFEPFRPLWLSGLILVILVFAYPWYVEQDSYDVPFVAGVPYWGVLSFLFASIPSALGLIQCYYFYDDWMTTEDYAKHSGKMETLDDANKSGVEMGGGTTTADVETEAGNTLTEAGKEI